MPRPHVRDDFEAHAARAVRRVTIGSGGVQDIQMDVAGPPLRSHARFVVSDGLTFMLGENACDDDLVLSGEHAGPLVAIQATLVGPALLEIEGLGARIGGSIGQVALYAAPAGRSTVDLRAGSVNQAFRVTFAAAKLQELAGRHRVVEPIAASVAARAPFLRWHSRPVELRPWITEVMNSEHLGPARPMFLEARALEWLAVLLAPVAREPEPRLPRREIARIRQARDILLARAARPPSLAELAVLVGTNEFALKRNFKLVFGEPPYAFLLGHRLELASRLLLDTDQSIKEIAAAIGYVHANHFSTAFRRRFGLTPAEHRKGTRR